jgi:hypothetical protein
MTGTAPTCALSGAALIYVGIFNDFGSSWGFSGITATVSGNVKPAKYRGQHFDGTNAYMSFTSLKLNFEYTIGVWLRLDSLANPMTVFSKNRNNPSDVTVVEHYISTGGELVTDLYDSDDWTATGVATSSVSSGLGSVSANWNLINYSVRLNSDAVGSDIRMWKNDETGDTVTLASSIFLDIDTGYESIIGARKTDDTNFGGFFAGFIYKFFIT